MNIVTGYRGVPHITANEQQAFNQGIFGNGNYVLNVGQKFEATLVDALTVTIADGEGVIQGVHFRIAPGDTDTVSISPGTTGYKRIDLICARYTKSAATGIEDVELVVVEGTPDASTPTAPTVNTGDILLGGSPIDYPLYEVDLDGLTPSLTQLFKPGETQNSDIYRLPFTSPVNNKITHDYTRLYIKPSLKLMSLSICFRLDASNTDTSIKIADKLPLAHGFRAFILNGAIFPLLVVNAIGEDFGISSFGTIRGTARCDLLHKSKSTSFDSESAATVQFGTAPGANVFVFGSVTIPYRRLNIYHPITEAVLVNDDI